MERWEELFDPVILKRGRNYFRQGLVRELRSVGDEVFTAFVLGSKLYSVTIQLRDGKVRSMTCSCPHAASGEWCKHMAAVLFAVDAQAADEGRTQPEEKPVRPFQRPKQAGDGERYRYFDFGRIAGKLTADPAVFAQAEELVRSGSYEQPVKTSFGYDEYYSAGGACVGYIAVRFPEKSRAVECFFRFSRDRILSGRCDCRQANPYGLFRPSDCLCRHQAATLLLLERYIEEHNPGDSTDRTAERFLTAFRRTRSHDVRSETAAPGSIVRLEPRLSRGADGLRLSFRAGEDRLYVVKDLSGFADAVQTGEVLSFGKTYAMDLRRSAFDPDSAPWVSLIRRVAEDERRRGQEIKGEIELSGSVLDEFFRIAQGSVLPFRDSENETDPPVTECLVTEGDPAVELTVRQDASAGSVFHGVRVEGALPQVYAGAEHAYYLAEGRLCRMSADYLEEMRPLFDLSKNGRIGFHVGRRNLSEFYYSVLPALRERAVVHEPNADAIAPLLPPELALVFYLDARDGVPSCRPRAFYGEASYALSDGETSFALSGDGMRDLGREAAALDTVRRYFPEQSGENGEYRCEPGDEPAYEALDEGVSALLELGEVQSTDQFRALRVRRKIKIAVGVSVESGLLELELSSPDVPQEELMDLLESCRLKRKFHRLKSGAFVSVDESVEELDMMTGALGLTPAQIIEGKAHLPAYRALYLDKMLEQCDSAEAVRDRRFRAMAKDFRTVDDADFEVPSALRDTLRSYQAYGYKWMRTLAAYGFGGILADDMGLGKTLQMIAVLLSAKEEGMAGTSIVITPASLVFNWQAEFQKFAPELAVCPVAGAQKERQQIIDSYDAYDVLITSYDLIKRDISLYEGKRFRYEVIDEAQYIKNHETSAAKSVKLLQSEVRFALTGTPIENRLSELWSIFDYLMPGFLYGYETFRRELETPIVRKNDERAAQRLRRMTAPFILRRLKGDVLKELPEKLEETRLAPLGEEQQRLYDAQVLRMRQLLAEQGDDAGFAKGKLRILAELTRLRQICCDPALLFEDYAGGSAKREACMELVESAVEGEHRILLFSQFTSMLEMIARELTERGIEYFTITGATPKAERLALVRRFNEGNVPVFLISLKAGGTGLNLTGADVVIHYDPWWNAAAQNQATDRAHRIGQEKVVTVYKLIAKNSVEEKIQALQEAKRELADTVLTGESVSLSEMSREDILALLQG